MKKVVLVGIIISSLLFVACSGRNDTNEYIDDASTEQAVEEKTESTPIEVDITADNWSQYFEIYYVPVTEDLTDYEGTDLGYDEEYFRFSSMKIKLKQEYIESLADEPESHLKLKHQFDNVVYAASLENGQIVVGDYYISDDDYKDVLYEGGYEEIKQGIGLYADHGYYIGEHGEIGMFGQVFSETFLGSDLKTGCEVTQFANFYRYKNEKEVYVDQGPFAVRRPREIVWIEIEGKLYIYE